MLQRRASLLLFQHFNRSRIPAIGSRCITNTTDDVCTHTGQKWDSDDYRLARFMNAPKHVNQNWAVKLIAEVPPKEVTERVIWCDGGSGPEGHPRVYINLDKPGDHSCGYCGLRFIKKESH
ncbi:PREDICTED: NADH dehydrogenase [ubiquinone] iron-sulfur protein 6, mitochondrial [Papilio xuthus]|uniref:NADH dehydrogenase [ubiquinone] iron-sulfur protein 6, mitochondrial n=2 Tax=Papilio xuthus TaxID=66420 RepID=A0A194PLI0_PAPXU|nr:PREDICTED: NADH dehydrogenase [ubiquinone] iron-sulfur protein 6, mitochondrial [Papilio xuthus]KPI93853.1 NADH dehydrogenase [ubiquinone] iron-sulfur protein 6, mitochondrial [Papilio xuthus]